MNEKVLFGPKFGTVINRKGLQFSELLHILVGISDDMFEVLRWGIFLLKDRKTGIVCRFISIMGPLMMNIKWLS
jgi:hypothetical protein